MNINDSNTIRNAFLNEAHFTREMLGAGATQIRQANYSQKGIYAQAFTSLSTGLERIGKLCYLLDTYIENGASFPTSVELRKKFGHDLTKLYSYSKLIVGRRSISFKFLNDISGEIHQSIIDVLNDFGKGDRYCNINLLVGTHNQNDPIAKWFNFVDPLLYKKHVSPPRQKEIIANYEAISNLLLNNVSTTIYISETGEPITNPAEACLSTEIFKAVAPYRQLYVLQIIRYWVEILSELGRQAEVLGCHVFPFFEEIFAIFYNSDRYFRDRKTWI